MKIGLTGGIACGKSTVASFWRALGHQVIDIDIIAKEVVSPGSIGLQRLVNAFGEHILLSDGSLDRSQMRALMLSHPDHKSTLEQITHPLVRAKLGLLRSSALESWGYFILENALLFENGGHQSVDTIVTVACAPEIQISRLVTRNHISQDEAQRWIKSQLPLQEKVKMSHYTIWNNHSFEQLQVDSIAIIQQLGLPIRSSKPAER